MATFESTRQMKVDAEFLSRARKDILAVMVDEAERFSAIKSTFESDQYLIDPHTSIGISASKCANSSTPMICLACAHWAKFPDAIKTALETLPEKRVSAAMITPETFQRIGIARASHYN